MLNTVKSYCRTLKTYSCGFYINAARSNHTWVTQSWVKYGQTQMLG